MAERSRKVRFSVSFIDHPALDADLISFLHTMSPKEQRELLAIWVRDKFERQKRQLPQVAECDSSSPSRHKSSGGTRSRGKDNLKPSVEVPVDEMDITTSKEVMDIDLPDMKETIEIAHKDKVSSKREVDDKSNDEDSEAFEPAFSFDFEQPDDEEVDESTKDAFNKAKSMFMI